MGKRILTLLFAYIPAGFIAISVLLVTILKWVPVTSTPLMLKRSIHCSERAHRQWVPLEDISENMVLAVIAAEDQKFLTHYGFDFEQIHRVNQGHKIDGSPIRGCSTISQQTAKNCFTFCTKSWFRKVIEAYYTALIERTWGKKRIMEVYLNMAEMGKNIYGIEAASQHYYSINSSDLTIADASSLACCLPNPRYRTPDWANTYMSAKRSQIARMAVKKRHMLLSGNSLGNMTHP